MSIDEEVLEEFKAALADKYEAAELVELLNLSVWDIIEMFPEKIMELHWR